MRNKGIYAAKDGYYVTKIVEACPERSRRAKEVTMFMFGDFRKDYLAAGLDARKYLWKIIKEWNNPSNERVCHWQTMLMQLRPTYYGNCIIQYPRKYKEDAEVLMKCLEWMENQDIYDIVLSVGAKY